MNPNLELEDDKNSRLEEVVASVLLRMDRGDDCDLATLIRNYPDLDEELREFFGDMQFTTHAVSLIKQAAVESHETLIIGSDDTSTAAPLVIPGFEVEGVIAQGGMGVVYRAVQKSLGRRVALKVLSPSWVSDAERLRRFKEEAQLAASLHLTHVLVIHDILEVDGSPVVVMPLIEGCDLRAVIAARQRGPLVGEHAVCLEWRNLSTENYLKRILVLLDKVIEATAGLHRAGVLHRDIKPSNILIDGSGNPWLADFGLAQLLNVDVSAGEAFGTLGYMAPELSCGESVDVQADIFSLGVTLYEALTLRRPFGTQIVSESHGPARQPSRIERNLSRDFDAVILKSIDPVRKRRYASVRDLSLDWQRVRQGILPQAATPTRLRQFARWLSKNRALTAAIIVAFFAVLATWWISLPGDGTLTVIVSTSIPCSRGALAPIDQVSGAPDEAKVIFPASTRGSLTYRHVPPGDYLLVVSDASGRFHEVYRKVPSKDDKVGLFKHQQWTWSGRRTVELPKVDLPLEPEKNMCRFEGAKAFSMGSTHINQPPSPLYQIDVEPFFLDTREVTVEEYCQAFPLGRSNMPKGTPSRSAMARVTYDEALAYLESAGKRPMSEAEYEFAATNGGTTMFPWGNDAELLTEWTIGLVGEPPFDRTATNPAVLGLYSNVAEWTSSRTFTLPQREFMHRAPEMLTVYSDRQAVRGGSYSIVLGKAVPSELLLGPRYRHMIIRNMRHPGLGIRGARSVRPRLVADSDLQSRKLSD